MSATFLERALLWERAKAALDVAERAEQSARDALLDLDFADRHPGTNTKPLPDGRVVKCVAETNHKIDAERANACIAKIEMVGGEEGKLLAARLFKWRPEVAVGELKKLPAQLRKIADKAIELRPARPSIRIETPAKV